MIVTWRLCKQKDNGQLQRKQKLVQKRKSNQRTPWIGWAAYLHGHNDMTTSIQDYNTSKMGSWGWGQKGAWMWQGN